ncbi:uncharacterized protein [Argopecten irradians]|uniref:uncharacterized protein n=1 Tax=Argopecten irradians TaxID=31199 RepID=UPI00371C83D9
MHHTRLPRHTELNLQLNPTTVFLDFETAAQNAIRSVFRAATLKGCFFFSFHAVYLEESPANRTSTTLRRQRRHQTTVTASRSPYPLVPLNHIEDVWFHALNDLENAGVPHDTTAFTDYVITQWIERDQPLWNHFETKGPRITNHVEGWYNKLKKKVEHSHPNIYSIIRVF